MAGWLAKRSEMIKGLGAGILICTILYRQWPVSSLTDPLRTAGFALLFIGIILQQAKSQKS